MADPMARKILCWQYENRGLRILAGVYINNQGNTNKD
jgi:hypothetical protein